MVRMLSEIINEDVELCVVGSASHGYEAVRKAELLHPEVITMDVNMPRMNGLKAVEHIMSTVPIPIVMISSLTQQGAETTIKALDLGAIDFVPKPSGYVSPDIGELAAKIIAKIKLAAKIRVVRTTINHSSQTQPFSHPSIRQKQTTCKEDDVDIEEAIFKYVRSHAAGNAYHYDRIVVIGCSTGGPQALNEILSRFPEHFPAPVLVVQHMPGKFTAKLAELLNVRIPLHVVEAREGMRIRKGMVYIAPGSAHMKILADRTIALVRGAQKAAEPCPSVNMLMQSASEVFGSQVIGVILTGMGNDGAEGMNAIKDANGSTIAQDEETSLVFGMPRVAIESGCVDSIVPLPLIAAEITSLTRPNKGKKKRKI
ncbi:chemotaxis response regulator protein-glutamate methylesterase [candidate division KSB3 bacterium]|uniref:Protein-glutamate methylesterase/protein-glutamine glutaminase n=1 Tax=candidate division KSB3 bacterium TaxID=2044937 RepID=A0A2G6KDP9_9BACT|nr:MAG: chemotaxis response regulator protein-glutamate methylesterase [candidate division KSB3 bacterium]